MRRESGSAQPGEAAPPPASATLIGLLSRNALQMPRVVALREAGMSLRVGKPGVYRIAIRYTPYWHASIGCVSAGKDGMIRLKMPRPGLARMTFDVDPGGVLTEMAGGKPKPCG